MIEHLIDLWVLKEYGTVIFSKTGSLNPNDHLFGKLIYALNSFSQSRFGDELLRFATDKYQYYIIEQQELLFVGIFPRNKIFKEKQILRELKKIGKKFCKKFTKEEVDNYDHNINKFTGFEEYIQVKHEVLGNYIDYLWNYGIVQES